MRSVDVGDSIGPENRPCPTAAEVAAYAASHDARERFFVDREFAQRLGYRDVIVPGPMQSAFLEQLIRREFPGWRVEQLSVTFRIAVVTGDTIAISGVVTEVHHLRNAVRVVCDLVIENGEGERATTGYVALWRAIPAD